MLQGFQIKKNKKICFNKKTFLFKEKDSFFGLLVLNIMATFTKIKQKVKADMIGIIMNILYYKCILL